VPVSCVCATLGQLGRNMGRPPLTTREGLAALRERELRQACDVLGIADLRLLRLFDKTVEFEDAGALAARIGAVIRETEPSLVITFHPEHGGHPDHNAVGAATLRAVAAMPPGRRPRLHGVVHPRRADRVGVATLSVEVTPVAGVKLEALRAHASQTQALLLRLSQDPHDPMQRLLREERFVPLHP
jgi:bacillithiol biosynthesis deacetylase BshB2